MPSAAPLTPFPQQDDECLALDVAMAKLVRKVSLGTGEEGVQRAHRHLNVVGEGFDQLPGDVASARPLPLLGFLSEEHCTFGPDIGLCLVLAGVSW